MSDWGVIEPDVDVDAEPGELDTDEPRGTYERREPGRAFGMDLAETTAAAVQVSFQKEIRKQVMAVVSETVEAAVEEALEDVFDESVVDDLRVRIETAAEDAVARELATINDDPEPEEPEPGLYYGSVDEFVREYLVGAYRRTLRPGTRVWAANWWEYHEAVIRLDALWRSWEQFRLDPSTGMSVWWRDHADHHMRVLFDPDGPFAGVRMNDDDIDVKGAPLPYTAPPDGLFPDVRVSPEG